MDMKVFPKELQALLAKPIAYESSLNQEQQQELMDVITAAVEKYSTGPELNHEAVARQIKESIDQQCGGCWHCVVGGGFSYAVEAREEAHLLCFYRGDIAVLCFKT